MRNLSKIFGMSSQLASCPASFLAATLMHLHQTPDTEGCCMAYDAVFTASRNVADTLQV